MALYYLGSKNLGDMYVPYRGYYCRSGYPKGLPPKPWPSWFKGQYETTIDPGYAKIFAYIPSIDQYKLWCQAWFYPDDWSWGNWCNVIIQTQFYCIYTFSSIDGRIVSLEDMREPTYMFPGKYIWLGGTGLGAGEKMYMTRAAFGDPNLYETDWRDFWNVTWQLSARETDPPTSYGPWGDFFAVNRPEGYLAWGGGKTLNLFRLGGDGVWHRFAIITLPVQMEACCYDFRDSLWWIGKSSTGSKIGKLNFKLGRHEFMSSLQKRYDDVQKRLIAFDCKRKRLAVLNMRPDDPVTGQCRWMLDFYYPLARVGTNGLTDPIPTSQPRVGRQTEFVSWVIGDVGEILPPYMVKADLRDPELGKLLVSFAPSNVDGRCHHTYQGVKTGTERLNLELSVEDRFEYETIQL